MKLGDLWTIVDPITLVPIVCSCSPCSNDNGFFVYRSRKAAVAAAQRQLGLFNLICDPCPLEMADLKIDDPPATSPADKEVSF